MCPSAFRTLRPILKPLGDASNYIIIKLIQSISSNAL